MLWKFVGKANVAFTIGDVWKRHSRIVITALSGSPPFAGFSLMAHKLFSVLGSGTKVVKWDELSQQLTLDILGTTVLGHDFDAIKNPDSPFARGYRQVMHALTEPPYVFLPFLDKYFPRREVEQEAQNLRKVFSQIIEYKRTHLADDLISHMIANPEFSDSELLDNVAVLFAAGHVCYFILF
jgi:cytochrome P450